MDLFSSLINYVLDGSKTTLELVTEIKRIERISEFNKADLARLRGGFLLADWVRRAELVSNDHQENPSKMMLYSSVSFLLSIYLFGEI
jgi:hypothetical protein